MNINSMINRPESNSSGQTNENNNNVQPSNPRLIQISNSNQRPEQTAQRINTVAQPAILQAPIERIGNNFSNLFSVPTSSPHFNFFGPTQVFNFSPSAPNQTQPLQSNPYADLTQPEQSNLYADPSLNPINQNHLPSSSSPSFEYEMMDEERSTEETQVQDTLPSGGFFHPIPVENLANRTISMADNVPNLTQFSDSTPSSHLLSNRRHTGLPSHMFANGPPPRKQRTNLVNKDIPLAGQMNSNGESKLDRAHRDVHNRYIGKKSFQDFLDCIAGKNSKSKERLSMHYQRTDNGRTMLHAAAKFGDLNVLQFLLANKVDRTLKVKTGQEAGRDAYALAEYQYNKIETNIDKIKKNISEVRARIQKVPSDNIAKKNKLEEEKAYYEKTLEENKQRLAIFKEAMELLAPPEQENQ